MALAHIFCFRTVKLLNWHFDLQLPEWRFEPSGWGGLRQTSVTRTRAALVASSHNLLYLSESLLRNQCKQGINTAMTTVTVITEEVGLPQPIGLLPET